MTQEQKKILLQDLSARLPFGVKCKGLYWEIDLDDDSIRPRYIEREVTNEITEIHSTKNYCSVHIGLMSECKIETVKPYLRPMESMTEEEKEELRSEFGADIRNEDNGRHTEKYGYVIVYHKFKDESWYIPFEAIDWLNAHHFDYRGLVPMGLAIEAPEGMYQIGKT